MNQGPSSKPYRLDERTFEFARDVRAFVRSLPKTRCNVEDASQLVRASGSVGANYIEANECLGKKDFFFRIRICRKETKESRYWLRLLDTKGRQDLDLQRDSLVQEATELLKIFSRIVENAK